MSTNWARGCSMKAWLTRACKHGNTWGQRHTITSSMGHADYRRNVERWNPHLLLRHAACTPTQMYDDISQGLCRMRVQIYTKIRDSQPPFHHIATTDGGPPNRHLATIRLAPRGHYRATWGA